MQKIKSYKTAGLNIYFVYKYKYSVYIFFKNKVILIKCLNIAQLEVHNFEFDCAAWPFETGIPTYVSESLDLALCLGFDLQQLRKTDFDANLNVGRNGIYEKHL